MTLGADYSPAVGRAHFLGVWRLMADLGSTTGPALLSAATAAALARRRHLLHRRCVALAAGGVLWYWIPRTARRPARLSAGRRSAHSSFGCVARQAS